MELNIERMHSRAYELVLYNFKHNPHFQVADLHGELLEFNERLHKQVNYYQYQVRRLREELVNLRGPVRGVQTKLGPRSLQMNHLAF